MEMSKEGHLPSHNVYLHLTYLKGGLDRRQFCDYSFKLFFLRKKSSCNFISFISCGLL